MTNRQPFPEEGYYQVRINGHLDETWSDWFEGMTITPEEVPDCLPTTLIAGFLPDQAALHGIIDRIGALGLTILSVERKETR